MSDLISRADAIEAVGKLLVDGQTARVDGKFVPLHFALMNVLSTLPSASVGGEWIPVSERLPNGKTEVIVSCIDDSGDTKFSYTSSGWVTTDKEYWIVDNEINPFVIAWMPLPKPYEGGGEDK